ncbi:MAG: hypothetical protein M5U26_09295 [Planctomycetota bacterium]|nr:hypothetical protein [Planctomycetota bacterium]
MPDSPKQFILKPETLAGLGALVLGPKGPLSPLRYDGPVPLPEEQARALREAGVLDRAGRPSEQSKETLVALAETKSFARVRLAAGKRFYDHTVYFAPRFDRAVAFTLLPDGVLIRDPAPTGEILEGLRQHTGGSLIRVAEFSAVCGFETAFVLAAALDFHRHAILSGIVSGANSGTPAFDAETLAGFARGLPSSPQWLYHVARDLVERKEPAEAAVFHAGLRELLEAGRLRREGERCVLADAARDLAEALPLVELVLTLNAARELPGGEVTMAGMRALQAGVRAVLTLDVDRDALHFECLSASALVEFLHFFLSNPGAVRGGG